ncbi:PepSY domain-containing protein [Streptomyces sp. BHT-5-2]|uniref:PepSY domain-containing protein n=1 Tax=Streptomyces sp. BHT-5-2 TaxID=2866715 RepID=UPI0021B11953|nr:PepSY domain-containing protein [Streptomyces sp. BHT-5-2]
MTTQRSAVLCTVVALGGALLAGCGNDHATGTGAAGHERAVPASAPAASPGTRLTADQAERKALIPAAKVDYERALRAAVAEVRAAKPVAAELKGTPKSPYWRTQVATSGGTVRVVHVDAVSGKAEPPRTDSADAGDRKKLAERLVAATVTPQQAVWTATARTRGTVSAVELGEADGGSRKPAWSVDVVTTADWKKTTYDIDATSRKVLRTHVDRD